MIPLRALIVDDNARNISVLARLLEEQNIESVEVTNPHLLDEALGRADRFDVVFLDLEMPGLDGFAVLRRLKADARFKDTPVIAHTVHLSEIHTAHQEGFAGFLGKPVDPDQFPERLARILRGEPVWEIR